MEGVPPSVMENVQSCAANDTVTLSITTAQDNHGVRECSKEYNNGSDASRPLVHTFTPTPASIQHTVANN